MILKIEIPTRILCVPAKDAGPIVAALENSFCVSEQGYGSKLKFIRSEESVACSFVTPDILEDKPAPLTKALADYEAAQSNWLGEYNKRTAAEAKIKELEAKLAAVQAVSGGEKKEGP